VIVHFCFLLPVAGSSIAYGRNVYSMPDLHKTRGTAKSRKSLSGDRKRQKEKNLGEEDT